MSPSPAILLNKAVVIAPAAPRFDWQPLPDEGQAFDAAVAATPDIDVICSSAAWGLAARHAFDPAGRAMRFETAGAQLALASCRLRGPTTLEPWELVWGFGCPIIGSDVALACEFAAATLANTPHWELCCLGGIPKTPAWQRAVTRKLASFSPEVAGSTTRMIASLEGGVDGYLSRRSAGFRKQWRRQAAQVLAAQLVMQHVTPTPDNAEAIYQRILAVEARSWKGRDGSGLAESPMREMYGELLYRMAWHGQAHVGFLRQGERDIAYMMGGLVAGTYRGFQFSYDHAFAAWSPGNLCQHLAIEALAAAGVARYDLGGDMAYKRHWAEGRHETSVWLLLAR